MIELERITVALPVKMASLIKRAIESGEYASNNDVFYDALRDWERKRQVQQQRILHIKAKVQRGLADLQAGHVTPADAVLTRLENTYQSVL